MENTHTSGYQAFQAARRKLLPRQKKPTVFEMTLEELKEEEVLFFQTEEDHQEFVVRQHVYLTYIKPRIEELER